ncbi:hypothetical protein MBLNU457_g0330t1 [Dothideomycetes sp. NU457]
MSQSSPKAKAPTANVPSQRLPAPSLFVAPPSHNANYNDIAIGPKDNDPSSPQSTTLSSQISNSPTSNRNRPRANTASTSDSQFDRSRRRSSVLPAGGRSQRPRPSKAQINTQWADLQNTLQDIELSAGQTHVFGPSHAEALRDLREAQIALAKAWGPGPDDVPPAHVIEKAKDVKDVKDGKDAEKGKDKKKEEQRGGEQDLSDAAARREANEKYFALVKRGVQDVVAKLDRVGSAMGKVEIESREIWNDGDSVESGVGEEKAG